jgi:hypothetical protein
MRNVGQHTGIRRRPRSLYANLPSASHDVGVSDEQSRGSRGVGEDGSVRVVQDHLNEEGHRHLPSSWPWIYRHKSSFRPAGGYRGDNTSCEETTETSLIPVCATPAQRLDTELGDRSVVRRQVIGGLRYGTPIRRENHGYGVDTPARGVSMPPVLRVRESFIHHPVSPYPSPARNDD